MPSSNILLFDQSKSNMLSDSDYSSNSQRASGLQAGIASSRLQNKFQYQVSLMAYALAQFMVAMGQDCLDTISPSSLPSNLEIAIRTKVTNTLWTKDNILSTATRTLFGLGSTATPNDVFQAIANNYIKVVTGSYTGNGSVPSSANPKSITFPVTPSLVGIYKASGGYGTYNMVGPYVWGNAEFWCADYPDTLRSNNAAVNNKTLSWWNNYDNVELALNTNNVVYNWFALGVVS